MAEKKVVIDGGEQMLVAHIARGPKGGSVLVMRLFDATGPHTFVLEDDDAKELLPLFRAIIPDQPALAAVADDGGEDA